MVRMEFKVIEESKHKIVFELLGETHTFCNALKNELLHVSGVKIATYKIDHPLIGKPKFMIETSKEIESRKAIKTALANLKKKAKEFLKEVDEM